MIRNYFKERDKLSKKFCHRERALRRTQGERGDPESHGLLRPPQQNRSPRNDALSFAVLFSIVVHILLLISFAYLMGNRVEISEPKEENVVELIPLEEMNEKYKLADIQKPEVEKRPEKAAFAGMYDSLVDEEMVSTKRIKGSKKKAQKKVYAKKAEPNDDVAFSEKVVLYERKLFDEASVNTGFSQGGLVIDDYFPDYRIGSHTYLNVKKFEDMAYFVRMKRVFKTAFNPYSAVEGALRLNQVRADRIETVVAVGVSNIGDLDELFVIKSSGVSTYDQEVLRTIRVSSPFSKPPDKFLDREKKLRINWAFVLYF